MFKTGRTLKLVFIPSSENIADIFTKATRRNVYLYLRDKMMYGRGCYKSKEG